MISLPEGSTVTISAQVTSPSGQEPTEIQIQVKDNGPGLPQESVRLLFDPFVVRSESPVEYGINLMTCYFIVHHHGGKIQAQSQEGQGTTFTIRLPTNSGATRTEENPEFLRKLLANDALWQKLATQ
jgi:signal transduction histidine kinase